MNVPATVRTQIEAKLRECIEKVAAHYGKRFEMPRVSYNIRGTTAGRAWGSKWLIELQPTLLMQNLEDMIENTVPHEFAHLACHRIYPECYSRGAMQLTSRGYRRAKREIHGPHWREIMHVLGADPSRCHDYDTTDVKRKRTSYDWLCGGCKRVVPVGPKVNAKLLRGHLYRTRCCRSLLVKPSIAGLPNVMVEPPKPVIKTPTLNIRKALEATRQNIPSKTGSSKLEICEQLYTENGMTSKLSRAEMIKLFVHHAGCTPAGASTYYQKCKGKFAG